MGTIHLFIIIAIAHQCIASSSIQPTSAKLRYTRGTVHVKPSRLLPVPEKICATRINRPASLAPISDWLKAIQDGNRFDVFLLPQTLVDDLKFLTSNLEFP